MDHPKLITRIELYDPTFDGVPAYDFYQLSTGEFAVARCSSDFCKLIGDFHELCTDSEHFYDVREAILFIQSDVGTTVGYFACSLLGWFCSDGGESVRLIVKNSTGKALVKTTEISQELLPSDFINGKFTAEPLDAVLDEIRSFALSTTPWSASPQHRWVADLLTLSLVEILVDSFEDWSE